MFALYHLLGHRIVPRIPNLTARRLHLFDVVPSTAGNWHPRYRRESKR